MTMTLLELQKKIHELLLHPENPVDKPVKVVLVNHTPWEKIPVRELILVQILIDEDGVCFQLGCK